MVDVRSVKRLYDELNRGGEDYTKLCSEDLDLNKCTQIKLVYQEYVKTKGQRSFVDFIKYLYPGLLSSDIARIREGIL